MKNVVLGLLIVALTIMPCIAIGEYEDVTYGDINNDGSIDSLDLATLTRYLNKKISLTDEQKVSANVDACGGVTMYDFAYLFMYLQEEIEDLPADRR